jgi:hypothetical protein
MKDKTRIQVFCGQTIETFCNRELHPVNEVKRAINLTSSLMGGGQLKVYTNSPNFVMAIKALADKHEINIEFFLNNVSQGRDIEAIFGDFNSSFTLLEEICGYITEKPDKN